MAITSDRLKALGLIDEIIEEPLGGAHRNPDATAAAVAAELSTSLATLTALPIPELIEQRREKLARFGEFVDK